MEYLNIPLYKIQKNPDFNHHAKCEKLQITNLTFVDKLLLFSIGDLKSIKLMMNAFTSFYNSTDLKMNPSKCKIYFGEVDNNTKEGITNPTTFKEGPFSFRYVGVPLTCKKLSIPHYMNLVDKIVARTKH